MADVAGTDLLSIYCHISKMIPSTQSITITNISRDDLPSVSLPVYGDIDLSMTTIVPLHGELRRYALVLRLNTTDESDQRRCDAIDNEKQK